MAPAEDDEITLLLNRAEQSDRPADHLWELIYPELRRRARNLFKNERRDHTLSATAVINEVFVRLTTASAREWQDRRHFYAAASGIMRHVLIDHARARRAAKRGGDSVRETLDEAVFPAVVASEAGYAEARDSLDQLALENDRAATVVALRVFGGLTVEEIAEELSVSERTVKSDWVTARVRLKAILDNQGD
ncbi:MAG: sigma-70 family RNA polymerase sigma factor [bacterium]|nr:sigma-70 family RNA polymerase sigma factor [bacterium]